MRIFLTKRSLENYLQTEVLKDRHKFMQATARNAAADALHYYVCYRTLDWWRQAIEQAEQQGNKYVSLAELFTVVQKENEAKNGNREP